MNPIRVFAPAPLDQRTGGYRYDRQIVDAMRANGRSARLEGLEGQFPDVDASAIAALQQAIEIGGDGPIVLDGLASAALAYLDPNRLPGPAPLLLMHHPFADDPDLPARLREWLARAEQSALLHATGVIATSAWTARRIEGMGIAAERVRVVQPGTEPAAAVTGSGGPGVRLLALGAVVPRKGHDVLVEALARLGQRDWQCRIVGSRHRSPDWARGITARTHELGIAPRIEWRGEVDEAGLDKAWEGVDALVVASHYEGYGMVVAEALARGLPVVATTGGALGDTLGEGCGWSVPPGDPGALATALAELIDRPGRRASRARAARRAGEALPGWTTQARAFAKAVDELSRHEDATAPDRVPEP